MAGIGKTFAVFLTLNVLMSSLALLMVQPANAQISTPTLEWSKTYSPNLGLSLDQTSDGGYIIAGVNRTGFHDGLSFSTIVTRTNSLGATLWSKQFGDNFSGPLFPIDIAKTSDSGYILSTPINELIKLNSQGDIEWNAQVTGGKVVQSNDGYVVAGFSVDSFGTTFSNVTKVGYNGNFLWIKSFDNGFHGNIAFRALSSTMDGNCAVAGNWGASFWFGILDNEGNFLVNKTYPSYGSSNIFSEIAKTDDGGFVLCGQNGNAKAILYKVDSQGKLEWNNTYSPSAFNSVIQTSDKGFVAGTSIGFLVKANANGHQEFMANYSSGISGVVSTADRGFAVTGTLYDRLWLAKFSLESNNSATSTRSILLVTVSIILVVLVCAGLLVYYKKHREKKTKI